MNAAGDFILSGNWSTLSYVDGRFARLQKLPDEREYLHTTGIGETVDGQAVGIACAGGTVAYYQNQRSVFHPAGQWTILEDQANGYAPTGRYRCAMNPYGLWAAYDNAEEILQLAGRRLAIPTGGESRLVALDDYFVLMGRRGLMHLIDHQGIVQQSLESPIRYMSESLRVKAQGRVIVAVDDFHAYKFTLEGQVSNLVLTQERLPVAPIDEGQGAGVSLAEDGSLVISGYWGAWLWHKGQRHSLDVRVDSGDRGAMAFAHNGVQGEFVVTGADDTDWGTLAKLQTPRRLQSVDPEREQPAWPSTARDDWWYAAAGLAAWDAAVPDDLDFAPVTVAVIDSGAQLDHAGLDQVFAISSREQSDARDNDDNGFIDDVLGYDFVIDQGEPEDKFGHGTHVTGILGRHDGPHQYHKIKVLRALDQSGKSTSLDLARAIHYALDHGIDILNCSWGGGRRTIALEEAFARAAAMGVLVFTSAGNDRLDLDDSPQVPGNFPGVINVGAIDRQGRLSNFSNWGAESVMFLAPGTDILSTVDDGGYGAKSGTSMASPLVANVAARLLALAKARYPAWSRHKWRKWVLDAMCRGAKKNQSNRSRCGSVHAGASLKYGLTGGSAVD
jgi:hypothetical protein